MLIPDPVANHGEKVFVCNYKKEPNVWETGKIRALRYENNWGMRYVWCYDVLLDRLSTKGNRMCLYVGDEQIRPVSTK